MEGGPDYLDALPVGVRLKLFQDSFIFGNAAQNDQRAGTTDPVLRHAGEDCIHQGASHTGRHGGLGGAIIDRMGHIRFGENSAAPGDRHGAFSSQGDRGHLAIIIAHPRCLLVPERAAAGGTLRVAVEVPYLALFVQLQVVHIFMAQG